jgi:hypothetical protein
MKIRVGFVSNSSSSSFVVAFPKGFKPTPANIKATLFADLDPATTFDTWDDEANDVAYGVREGRMSLDGMVRVIADALGEAEVLALDSNDVYVFYASSENEHHQGLLREHVPFEAVPYLVQES